MLILSSMISVVPKLRTLLGDLGVLVGILTLVPPHFLLQLWSYTSCSSTIFITPILELKFITPLLPQFLYFFLFFHKSVRGSAVATVDSPVIICGGFSQATKIKLTEALGLL